MSETTTPKTVRYFTKRNPARPIEAGGLVFQFVICDFIAGAYRGVYKDEKGEMPDEAIYDAEKNPAGKAVLISEQEYLSILEKKRPSTSTTETPSSFQDPQVKQAAATAEAAPAPDEPDEVDPDQISEVAPAESPKELSFVTNKKALAEALDLTPERVEELLKRNDSPGRSTKGYTLSEWREYAANAK